MRREGGFSHVIYTGYLVAIGVEPGLVHELLNNQGHPNYIAPDMSGIAITVDVADALEAANRANSIPRK